MELTPDQRDRIQRLLEDELRTAYRSALDRGCRPADVLDVVAGRRRALTDSLRVVDDPEHPVDDAGESGDVGEQR